MSRSYSKRPQTCRSNRVFKKQASRALRRRVRVSIREGKMDSIPLSKEVFDMWLSYAGDKVGCLDPRDYPKLMRK